MSIEINWIGHATFSLDSGDKSILIDPFINDNPMSTASANDFNPDIILLSHAHGDHVADVIDVAKRTNATIVCNFEMGNWFLAKGIKNVFQGNPGGTFDGGFIQAKWTIAFHSSSFPDGTYGGQPNGFIITFDNKKLYYAGDTNLFGDMQLIGSEGIDLAILPIGDVFTMGPADSIKAIQMIKPRYVIPMHYNTFPPIQQDVHAWRDQVKNETNAEPIVLEPGEVYSMD